MCFGIRCCASVLYVVLPRLFMLAYGLRLTEMIGIGRPLTWSSCFFLAVLLGLIYCNNLSLALPVYTRWLVGWKLTYCWPHIAGPAYMNRQRLFLYPWHDNRLNLTSYPYVCSIVFWCSITATENIARLEVRFWVQGLSSIESQVLMLLLVSFAMTPWRPSSHHCCEGLLNGCSLTICCGGRMGNQVDFDRPSLGPFMWRSTLLPTLTGLLG